MRLYRAYIQITQEVFVRLRASSRLVHSHNLSISRHHDFPVCMLVKFRSRIMHGEKRTRAECERVAEEKSHLFAGSADSAERASGRISCFAVYLHEMIFACANPADEYISSGDVLKHNKQLAMSGNYQLSLSRTTRNSKSLRCKIYLDSAKFATSFYILQTQE